MIKNVKSIKTYGVDKSMQDKDRELGVLNEKNEYKLNPTAKPLSNFITKNNPNYIESSKVNGQFMYVVKENGEIIIGTRDGRHMPHPTLIGGISPRVQGAGILEIRGGKIYKVDNASGHFKPENKSLINVEKAFNNLIENSRIFHKDFQGYVVYE